MTELEIHLTVQICANLQNQLTSYYYSLIDGTQNLKKLTFLIFDFDHFRNHRHDYTLFILCYIMTSL